MSSVEIALLARDGSIFVEEKVKVSAKYHVWKLLPNLIEDCKYLLLFCFTFQKEGAPNDTACLTRTGFQKLC